jgi:ethanolamine transporter EutH
MFDMGALKKIALGEVECPRIEMEVDGGSFIAEGENARYLALGIMAGIKAMHPDSQVSIDDRGLK